MSAKEPILLDFRAEKDIDSAAQWYAEKRSELALEFLNAVSVMRSRFPVYS